MSSENAEKAADLEDSQAIDKLGSMSPREETLTNIPEKDGHNSIQINEPDTEDDFFSVHGEFSRSNSSSHVSITEQHEPKTEDKKLAELCETDQVHQNRTKLLVEFLLQDEFPSSNHSSSFDFVNSTTSIEEKSIQLYLSRKETDSKLSRQNLKLGAQNHNCKGCCFPSLKKTGKNIT